jgi:organic hydroperoxide reductase OsmC/OhrA
MSEHEALIEWRSDGRFAEGSYSRGHAWKFDGGAEVRGSSSPRVVPEPMSDAAGVDPEEALVASASSCHMLWFLSLAREAGFDVESYSDRAGGTMGRGEDGRIAITRITLRPSIVFAGRRPDTEELARLHHEAHEKCFIANSLRSEIVIEG